MDIQDIIKLKNWCVIGDVGNESKYAYRILEKFKGEGYNVSGVHPKGGDGIFISLKEVPYKIEAIDLCINPKLGIEFIKEAKELEVKHVLIQPGAESDEIIEYCKINDIEAIQGCALVELG